MRWPRLWWLIAFDLLLSGWFFYAFALGLSGLQVPDPEAAEADRVAASVTCPLDGGISAVLLGAGLLLLSRSRWAALCQRAAFWALLLRCGVVVLELSLPSEGGVSGFLILIGLPALVLLTVMAFIGAVAVSRSNKAAEMPE